MKEAVIIGGGPAGLTAAYELLSRSNEYHVTILEESRQVGGISRTAIWQGNRMDMGGHRFFSKMPEINQWWEKMLPLQKSASGSPDGPDPEKTDEVMLLRHRVSRILFDGKFYDYPISLKPETFRNMGLIRTLKCGFSWLHAALHKLPEENLENFYINSFGKQLYTMFFEDYTEKLWGRHPREIDPSWGAQRTRGLSIRGIIQDIGGKILHVKNRQVNTSLIEEFKYPKLGPGELWEIAAQKVRESGGEILLNARVTALEKTGNRLNSVTYEKDGTAVRMHADLVISSMPIRDLVSGMNEVPDPVRQIAAGLPYRDFMTLGVLINKSALMHQSGEAMIPDCWIYVQDRSVKMGRIQIFNNWSPYLVRDPENTVWLGLEYFCTEGDDFWNQSEGEFSRLGVDELIRVGLIRDRHDVLGTHMEKVRKAYPAYFDSYSGISTVVEFLNYIENLYCVGRNGQHRYNNMDHSMMTSIKAIDCILSGSKDRTEIWNVNTEKEYHEEKKSA